MRRKTSDGKVYTACFSSLITQYTSIYAANSHTLGGAIIISFPSPTYSFIPGLKPSFSGNPSHRSLFFISSSGLTTWIPQTFTVTSEHIRFYFLVFLFYTF